MIHFTTITQITTTIPLNNDNFQEGIRIIKQLP